jgi:hypothetical protein
VPKCGHKQTVVADKVLSIKDDNYTPMLQPTTMIERPCDKKTALLSDYQKAAEAYANMVSSLVRLVGTAPHSEYEVASQKAEAFCRLTNETRERLERHTAEHGC